MRKFKLYDRVQVISTNKKSYMKEAVVGHCGKIVRYKESFGTLGVQIDDMYNHGSHSGIYWFDQDELESEDLKMTGFNYIAIVNLLDDYNKKDYAFALYDEEYYELPERKDAENTLVVVNARGKNNRVLGTIKEVKTVEEYGKNVTAQVVAVVDISAYNARVAEEEHQKEIDKKKKAIEAELRAEIEKLNNIALYETMAKQHPENLKLANLLKDLKALGE